MNCDEAFECLTDPSGRNSDALKWHLDLCPRCRQMQEVLSPAINLLVSPVETGDAETSDFETFSQVDESGFDLAEKRPLDRVPRLLPAESIRLAEKTAAELSQQSLTRTEVRRRRFHSLSRFAVLFFLGAVITFAATAWSNRRERNQPAATGNPSPDQCLWIQHERQKKPASRRGSQKVVLSCVNCHFSQPLE